jgi:endo-1,4-beta-xylanase
MPEMKLGTRRLVIAGAVTAAALSAPAARAGGVQRVVEGESLRGVGAVVVRDAAAAGGRALLIEPGGTASRPLETGAVGSIVVRGKRRACGRRLRISVDGGAPITVRLPRGKLADRAVALALAPGRHVLRISSPARSKRRKRCGISVDRLRLRAPAPNAAPAPAPVAGPAPAPAPAPAARVPLGTSAQLQHLHADPAYGATMTGAFSSFSPENELKMEWTQPQKDTWSFAAADSLVDFAQAHRLTVRGHTVIFGSQTPPWVQRELLPGAIKTALETQVRTVMSRYKDRIHEWDVVNEALNDNGGYRSNPFFTAMGETYVDRAFEVARSVDPTARLYYNEINAEVDNVKRAAVVRLLQRLKSKGLVDGVGLQLHTAVGHAPSQDQLLQTMRLYEGMGLEVQITEMDVDLVSDQAARPLADRVAEQAAIYRGAAQACAAVQACKRFTVWGVSDRYSWLGADRQPLLLDAGYQPKPALASVRSALGL